MRRWFGFLIALLFSFSSIAQGVDEASLLNIKHRETQKNFTIFEGQPIVHFDEILSDTRDEMPVDTAALLPPPQIQVPRDITLSTPLKSTITTAFTPQTTDFIFIVQVLNDSDILVEERFQFITTEAGPFSRALLSGDKQVELIAAAQNGRALPLFKEKTPDGIRFTSQAPLPQGAHTLMLRYRVKNALTHGGSTWGLDWNLTGNAWPFPINNTVVLVQFPTRTSVFQKELRFGTNDMRFQEAFTVQTDAEGNQLYRLNQLLPAYANVRLLTTFDALKLPPREWDDFWNNHLALLAGSIGFLCLVGYLILTAISLIYERLPKQPRDKMHRFGPLVWTRARGYRITLSDIQNILKLKHKNRFDFLFKNRFIGAIIVIGARIYVFLRLTSEYILGALMILGLTAYIAADQGVMLDCTFWGILGSVAALGIYGLYLLGCQTILPKLAAQLVEALTSEEAYLHQTPAEMKKSLPIIAALRLQKRWMAGYNTYHTTEKDFFTIDDTTKNV